MKKTLKSTLIRFSTALLATIILILGCVSCSSKGKTLVSLNKDGHKASFSVNFYELLLSRWKGALVANQETLNGYSPNQEQYYDIIKSFDGVTTQTLSEYYSDMILETCKTYTAVLWLFEAKGLTLAESDIAEIDNQMKEILDTYGEGSKTKLNSILSNYGVNYNLLREMYLMELKVGTLQKALYGAEGSLLGQDVKDAHLEENYVHFKQIFLPYFRYEYKTDQNGDEIYYLKESTTGKIAYDTANGYTRNKADGTPDTDVNGDDIYYTSKDYTKIAYNKDENVSMRSYKLDSNGEAITIDMTQDEINEVIRQGNDLFDSLKDCSVAEFEKAVAEKNKDGGTSTYPDGYYLDKNLDYAGVSSDFSYFSDIVTAMDAMENGQIAKILTDQSGYHIVMKYAPTPKAYEDDTNEVWFKNFTSSLVEKLFLAECELLFPDMVVDEKVLASASDIKKLGANASF